MHLINHGCGVLEFPNAVAIDDEFLGEWLERRREHEPDDYYIDEDGKIVNRGGFKFEAEEYFGAPGRFLYLLHSEVSEEDRAFVQSLDDAINNCLEEYLNTFPDASQSVWWGSDGHIATYSDGQNMGSHADQGIRYSIVDQKPVSVKQDAMHNVISSSMILRAPIEGGELTLKHAGATIEPVVGTAVLYPSNYIGAHAVSPVVSGERWSYLKFWGSGKARQYPREVLDTEYFVPLQLPGDWESSRRD